MALYGADTRTLHKVDQKYLENFGMWCWRRMKKISWANHVRNEVLQRIKEERNILQTIKGRKEGRLTGFVTSYVGTAF